MNFETAINKKKNYTYLIENPAALSYPKHIGAKSYAN